AALSFRFRHALYAMRPGFELELAVHTRAFETGNDFLVAADFSLVRGHDFNAPAAIFCVTRIHTQQISCEQGAFVATRAGANLKKHTAIVIRVRSEERRVGKARTSRGAPRPGQRTRAGRQRDMAR